MVGSEVVDFGSGNGSVAVEVVAAVEVGIAATVAAVVEEELGQAETVRTAVDPIGDEAVIEEPEYILH